MSDWCTIESDPAVFTELIEKFGVENVEVQELWGLDKELSLKLSPIYGLIFLFKWDKKIESEFSDYALDEIPDGVFFSKQMINNACGTQAIINILLNNNKNIKLGNILNNFLSFTNNLDPESIGLALQNSNDIKNAHNSFSRPEPLQIDKDANDDEEGEAFHFISYVPINGILYEMDGLQKGPRLIDGVDEDDWFEKAATAIQNRMKLYQNSELRFTLLAVCANQLNKYENLLKNENDQQKKIELKSKIEAEKAKRLKWKKENIRRRHNYFPFIFSLLKSMANKNVLQKPLNKAIEAKKKKLENREKEKQKKIKDENEKKEDDKDKDKDKKMDTDKATDKDKDKK